MFNIVSTLLAVAKLASPLQRAARQSARAEKEFARGMDLAARGRDDLAQKHFDRAEKLGMDIKERVKSVGAEDLKEFEKKINASRSGDNGQQPLAPDRRSSPAASDDSKPGVTTDSAGVGSGADRNPQTTASPFDSPPPPFYQQGEGEDTPGTEEIKVICHLGAPAEQGFLVTGPPTPL